MKKIIILAILLILCAYLIKGACDGTSDTFTLHVYDPHGSDICAQSKTIGPSVGGTECNDDDGTKTTSCNVQCEHYGTYRATVTVSGSGGHSAPSVINPFLTCDYDDCIDSAGPHCCEEDGSSSWKWGLTIGDATSGSWNITCCGDDAGEDYVIQGVGTGSCCDKSTDCVDSGNICRENINESNSSLCGDYIDNDCDGKTDCEESSCGGGIIGYVRDQDNKPLEGAKVEAFNGSIKIAEDLYTGYGSYGMNVGCGTYRLAASKTDYIPSTKTDVSVPSLTTIQRDFTLISGVTCEEDCSYLIDDRCHASCDGVNNCSFYNSIAREKCDLAKVGWRVFYNPTQLIECCEGKPENKSEIKAVITCTHGNVFQYHTIVDWQGKPIRMVSIVCGD